MILFIHIIVEFIVIEGGTPKYPFGLQSFTSAKPDEPFRENIFKISVNFSSDNSGKGNTAVSVDNQPTDF